MRIPRAAVLLIATLLVGSTALADEIIHFTSGSSLPVKSYTIENGMITVVLSDAATIAFPETLVERIESTTKRLAGVGYEANLRQAGGPKGTYSPGINQAVDFSDVEQVTIMDLPDDVKVDGKTGMALHRPFAHSPASNKRKLTNAGSSKTMSVRLPPGQGGYKGTRRMGGKHVMSRGSSGRPDGAGGKTKVMPTLAHPDGPPPTYGETASTKSKK